MINLDSAGAQKLKQAFVELLLEKPYKDISIGEITKRAGINRTTFYLFWENKDSLLEHVSATLLEDHLQAVTKSFDTHSPAVFKKCVHETFDYVAEQRDVIQALWSIESMETKTYYLMQNAYEESLKKKYRSRFEEGDPRLDIFSAYFAAGTMSTLRWWASYDRTPEDEAIGEEMISVISLHALKMVLKDIE